MEDSKKEKERLHFALDNAEERERGSETLRFQMERELELKRLQLTDVEGDVRSNVTVLTGRLEVLMGERSVAEDQSRMLLQRVSEMERESVKKGGELAQAQR